MVRLDLLLFDNEPSGLALLSAMLDTECVLASHNVSDVVYLILPPGLFSLSGPSSKIKVATVVSQLWDPI